MSKQGEKLAKFIRDHHEFAIVTSMDGNYGHMGATLTDAVLQAGISYKTVVRPRVRALLTEYPNAKTTSTFAELLESIGAGKLLKWKGKRKLEVLSKLTEFLLKENIDTEEEFRAWIILPGNIARLRDIKGIKDKTSNYLEILLGLQSVAVDRYLFRFLAEAGLETNDYGLAHSIIFEAAGILGVEPSLLDHSIWRHMSERPKVPEPRSKLAS